MREIHIKLGIAGRGECGGERERERVDAKERGGGKSATTRARTNIICLTASRSHGLMVTGIAVVVIRQQLVVVPSLIAR